MWLFNIIGVIDTAGKLTNATAAPCFSSLQKSGYVVFSVLTYCLCHSTVSKFTKAQPVLTASLAPCNQASIAVVRFTSFQFCRRSALAKLR